VATFGGVIVDELLDRLEAAVLDARLPRPWPIDDLAAIQAAEAEIAPLTFPPAVRRPWERVNPGSFVPDAYPPLMHPAGGVLLRRQNYAHPGPGPFPHNLFPLGYESWAFLLVELPSPTAPDRCGSIRRQRRIA